MCLGTGVHRMQGLARTAASRLPTACELSDSRPQMACLLLAARPDVCGREDGELDDRLLSACRRFTPQVERVSSQRVLLDLGTCSEREARAAMETLMRRVADVGFQARAGIAPSLTLAQLAALTAGQERPLVLIAPDTVQTFLRGVPVSALLRLYPSDRVTSEIVERLERYGLRTLGHLARLDEPALRRQFGAVGRFLAAVAAGRDEQPLHPTPLPPEYRARLRLGSAAAPDRVLAALELFTEWIAAQLRCQGRQTRRLRVRVRWECGCAHGARLSLRQHTNDSALLARELRRLLMPLLRAHREHAHSTGSHAQTLDGLWLALGDFAPVVPCQATFWRTRDQRLAAMQLVADALTQRHGRPLLLHWEPVEAAAIFTEERHRLSAFTASESARADPSGHHWVASQSGAVPAAPADPWQAVPQRLHWW